MGNACCKTVMIFYSSVLSHNKRCWEPTWKATETRGDRRWFI